MVTNRHISKIICILMGAAVLFCILAQGFARQLVEAAGGTGMSMEYATELFGTDRVIQVDIQMGDGEWEEMLADASQEVYYSCDVVINGQKINNVGIRPKGNTSLSAIVSDPDTDRFSLKLEFDHYVEGQTFLGLDKLILNNNYADATNMKEAVVYDMYRYLEADASLYNYARLSVNGTYWGVYLALEAVEDSFLLRNYGAEDGALYKPDSMRMGGGFDGKKSGSPDGRGDGSRQSGMPQPPGGMPEEFSGQMPGGMPEGFSGEIPAGVPSFSGDMQKEAQEQEGSDGNAVPPGEEGSAPFGQMGEGFSDGTAGESGQKTDENRKGGFSMGGFSMGGNGANLNYIDDDPDSYSDIWEGEVTDTGKEEHRRVVTALKNVSQGTNLEEFLDIDNLLKYMAVHTFSVNMDSLSGSMAHNYYLYEYNGKLNIIPWDYNLSFGGMSMGPSGSASDMINDAIDTPFQATEFFDALLEDEEYLSRYHDYLRKLTQEYVFGGGFQSAYERIRSQIDALVQTDPTAFYSYEEYTAAAEMLYQTILLRAESIEGQLDGTIPSTDAGQRQDSSNLIDASAIDIATMGVFNMGGRSFQFNGMDIRFDDSGDVSSSEENDDLPANSWEGRGTPPANPFEGSGGLPGDIAANPGAGDAFIGSFGNQRQNMSVILQNGAIYASCLVLAVAALAVTKRRRR